jgi:Protein of unknown function (DUF4089)
MKRQKPKSKRTKMQPKKRSSPAAAASDIAALVAASARALGLAIDPAWEANVSFNLQLILRHAALVDAFPLPDDAEPAPIFHA